MRVVTGTPGQGTANAAEFAIRAEGFTVRLAQTAQEIEAALRLRFAVFNIELGEGLPGSFESGIDRDQFDDVCAHLIVQHNASGDIIGTYRMQTGSAARFGHGFYSAREFDFSPYQPLVPDILELGRACIRRDHRNFLVMNLLWRGVARYAQETSTRYLIGCSSVQGQDETKAAGVYRRLQRFLAPDCWQTKPAPGFEIPAGDDVAEVDPPKLLRAYLAVGAHICGPPALDREFGTIDFLTLLDLKAMSPVARARFLGISRCSEGEA